MMKPGDRVILLIDFKRTQDIEIKHKAGELGYPYPFDYIKKKCK